MSHLNIAETLGSIVRATNMLLEGYNHTIGSGWRMELLVPACFCNGESVYHGEACILPASKAVVGELLRVDDHLIYDTAVRNMFRVFLVSVYQIPVVGGGKFSIEERDEGIVFRLKD